MVDLTGGKSPTFTGTYSGSGTGRVQLASGTFAGSGAVLNFPRGLFVFSGGMLGGTVTNAGAGFITDTGGTLSGTLTNQGTIVQPSGTLTISGTLSNAGTYNIALASSASVTSGSGTFTNLSTGTLELTTNVTATLASPFANQGGLVETTAAVSGGTLVLGGGGTSTGGTYNAVNAGAAIDAAGSATSVWTGTYSGTGAGAVEVSLGGAIAPGAAGATLDFTAERLLVSNGEFNVQGNTLTNAGTIALTNTSGVVGLAANNYYTGAHTYNLGGTLINTGTIVQQGAGSLEMYDNTILSNRGTYQLAADSNILSGTAAPNSFVNSATGTVKLTAGSGTASIEVPFNNQGGTVDADSGTLSFTAAFTQTGTVSIASGASLTTTGAFTQSAGTTTVARGATLASKANTVSLTGGLLTGTGVVVGNVTNAANVVPGGPGAAGMLTIVGSYTETSAGTLTINVDGTTAGTNYGQLTVTGVASLDGNLNVNLFGGYAPNNNDEFQVLNYALPGGQFANLNLMNFPTGTTLTAYYSQFDLILAATAPQFIDFATLSSDLTSDFGIIQNTVAGELESKTTVEIPVIGDNLGANAAFQNLLSSPAFTSLENALGSIPQVTSNDPSLVTTIENALSNVSSLVKFDDPDGNSVLTYVQPQQDSDGSFSVEILLKATSATTVGFGFGLGSFVALKNPPDSVPLQLTTDYLIDFSFDPVTNLLTLNPTDLTTQAAALGSPANLPATPLAIALLVTPPAKPPNPPTDLGSGTYASFFTGKRPGQWLKLRGRSRRQPRLDPGHVSRTDRRCHCQRQPGARFRK